MPHIFRERCGEMWGKSKQKRHSSYLEWLIRVIRLEFSENISGMPEIPTYCLYIDIKLMMGCSQSDLRIQLSVIPFRMCRVFSNEGFFQR